MWTIFYGIVYINASRKLSKWLWSNKSVCLHILKIALQCDSTKKEDVESTKLWKRMGKYMKRRLSWAIIARECATAWRWAMTSEHLLKVTTLRMRSLNHFERYLGGARSREDNAYRRGLEGGEEILWRRNWLRKILIFDLGITFWKMRQISAGEVVLTIKNYRKSADQFLNESLKISIEIFLIVSWWIFREVFRES